MVKRLSATNIARPSMASTDCRQRRLADARGEKAACTSLAGSQQYRIVQMKEPLIPTGAMVAQTRAAGATTPGSSLSRGLTRQLCDSGSGRDRRSGAYGF